MKANENWTQARQEEAHLLFQDWHSPRSRTAASPKLFAFREAVYKRPLKEEEGLFAFGLGFSLWAFLVWEAFGKEKNY
jgi:hypothetical protein